MSKVMRNKRKRRKPTKRFDMSEMIKALEDAGFVRGFFSCLGVVKAAQDGGQHFDLDEEDLTVEVELMPSRMQISARVGTVAGGSGCGIWKVPPVGAEVLVAVPDGDMDFQPTIASWYSSGQLPEDIGEDVIVIAAPAGGKVLIHDGSGSVQPLVTKAEFDAHKHPTGVGLSSIPDNAPITGTTTLEVK